MSFGSRTYLDTLNKLRICHLIVSRVRSGGLWLHRALHDVLLVGMVLRSRPKLQNKMQARC